jgi:hypothetical protein
MEISGGETGMAGMIVSAVLSWTGAASSQDEAADDGSGGKSVSGALFAPEWLPGSGEAGALRFIQLKNSGMVRTAVVPRPGFKARQPSYIPCSGPGLKQGFLSWSMECDEDPAELHDASPAAQRNGDTYSFRVVTSPPDQYQFLGQ